MVIMISSLLLQDGDKALDLSYRLSKMKNFMEEGGLMMDIQHTEH